MENSHKNIQAKKLYEVLLTNGKQTEIKKDAVSSIIKMAVSDHSHFSFLLNQVDWFCDSNIQLIHVLGKVLRAYRGTSKTAPKVVYNLLAVGLSIPKVNLLVVDLLVNIIQVYKDTLIAIEAIRENYPHKVCNSEMHINYISSLLQLSLKMPSERFNLLEIIIQNLSTFDTEVALGEQFVKKVDYHDEDALELAQKCQELQNKYDLILQKLFQYVSKFDNKGKQALLKQIYLIFQKVMMTVDNTKMIQYVAFYLAQSSLESSSSFLALLMVTILQHYQAKKSKRIYIAALQYLRSYLYRSTVVPSNRVKKIIGTLLNQLKQKISLLQKTKFQDLNLSHFAQQNYFNLYMLQTIIYLKCKFPTICHNEHIKQLYENVIQIASQKLHYKIFIDSNLISALQKKQVKHDINVNTFKTIYLDKFIPFFLPQSQKYIKMKLNIKPKRQRPEWSMQQSTQIQQMGTLCRKLMSFSQSGGFTPVTIEQC